MTGYLIDYRQSEWELPPLISWTLCHGMGTPADSFEICFPWTEEATPMLNDAVRFKAIDSDEVVFSGVVDEYEISITPEGAVVSVSGRGLAALLLDNESEAVEYYQCSLETILARHVRPYGITKIKKDPLPSALSYKIDSGSSQWTALYNYTHYVGGVTPRFSRDGVLIISDKPGKRHDISLKSAPSAVSIRGRRYGRISQVKVVRAYDGSYQTVYDSDFMEKGGSCRRVVMVPKTTGYNRMRYTGEFQIKQSKADYYVVKLVLPQAFAAFPADIVDIDLPEFGLVTEMRVRETISWSDGKSSGTELSLVRM
ncbi:MAG: hypothetical protein IJG63_05875 [Oscillospiraceae bacterium]|nr:hypothetical protein [Oscillospiraceae bacterium]